MRLAPLLATGLALLATAPASAATITDPTGDATTGDAGHDITQFDWSYDAAAGVATGTITVAGPTATDAGLLVGLGVPGPDGVCTIREGLVLLGTKSLQTGAWQRVSGGNVVGSPQPADRSGTATSFTISAQSAELANQPYACAEAEVTDPEASATVYDNAAASVPAPQPTPTPTPAPTTPPAPQPAPAAKLKATLKGVPAKLKRGRTAKARLTVRNTGTAASKAVTLRVRRARGLTVKPGKVTVKGLAPGKAKAVTLRLTLGKRARARTPLVLSGRGVAVRRSIALAGVRKPKPKPTPSKGGLADTFWWWNDPLSSQGWNLYALRFYANGYAYYRLPEDKDETAPAKCTSVTAKADEDGDYGTGCVRWSLKGSSLTISDPKVKGTYRGGKLQFGDIEASRLSPGKPGQRLALSLEHRDFRGFCGLITGCTTWHDRLTLQKDGLFGKASSSVTTSGDAGGGGGLPFIGVASYPPDSRGTYEILPGYRIRLSFADGTEKVFPFGIGAGKGKDAEVVLGEANYYVDPTPEDD